MVSHGTRIGRLRYNVGEGRPDARDMLITNGALCRVADINTQLGERGNVDRGMGGSVVL